MDNWQTQNMLQDLIYFLVRDKIVEGTDTNLALRFDFRMKEGGARSLLFFAPHTNRRYVAVYWLKQVNGRSGGQFPVPGSDDWQFIADHDCMTRECIKYFF